MTHKYLNVFFFKTVKVAVLSILGLIATSCGLFIIAVGGVESDLSNQPEYAHLFDNIYEFKQDVFLYRYIDDYTSDVIHVGLPGIYSSLPKTITSYEDQPENHPCVKGIVREGTKFKISKVAKNYAPSGLEHFIIYIYFFGYNNKDRIEAGKLCNFYQNQTCVFKTEWVRQVD